MLKPILALAFAAGLLAACETPRSPTVACDFDPMLQALANPEPVLAPPIGGGMTLVPLNAVSITDVAITNKVLVQQVSARRTDTGTLEVSTRLVNCTDFPLQVEGRTHFLDEADGLVEPISAWQRVFLPARAFGNYAEKSVDVENVKSYLIEIREGL